MTSKVKATLNNFLFGSFSNVFLIIIGLVMVPYYLKFFSLATYGAWLASGNIVALLGSLESGISYIITQKLALAYGQKDFRNFKIISGSGISFILLVAAIFSIILFFILPYMPEWVKCPENEIFNFNIALKFAIVSGAVGLINSTVGAFSQVWQLTLYPNVIRNISNVINVGLIVLFINLEYSIASISIAAAIKEVLILISFIYYTRRIWKKKNIGNLIFSLKSFMELIKEITIPFIGQIGRTFIDRSHNFIIASFVSAEASAIYEFTAKSTLLSKFFVSVFTNGFFGSISLSRAEKDVNLYIKDISNTLMIFTFLITLLLGFSFLFSEDIVRFWVGADMFGGTGLLFVIVLAYLFKEFFQYLNNIQLVEASYNIATGLQLFNAVFYIGVSYYCLTKFDSNTISLPLGILIASFFASIISYKYLKKKLKLKSVDLFYPAIKILLIIIPIVSLFFIFRTNFRFESIPAVLILVGLYFMVVICVVMLTHKNFRNIVFSIIKHK